MESADIREAVGAFEVLIRSALENKYERAYAPHHKSRLAHNSLLRMDLLGLINLCLMAAEYPRTHLDGFMYRLMDFKLQLYYIQEVDLGVYNANYYGNLLYKDGEPPPPQLLLMRLTLDQNLIGKSRILWERLMQSIYYLELGKSHSR